MSNNGRNRTLWFYVDEKMFLTLQHTKRGENNTGIAKEKKGKLVTIGIIKEYPTKKEHDIKITVKEQEGGPSKRKARMHNIIMVPVIAIDDQRPIRLLKEKQPPNRII